MYVAYGAQFGYDLKWPAATSGAPLEGDAGWFQLANSDGVHHPFLLSTPYGPFALKFIINTRGYVLDQLECFRYILTCSALNHHQSTTKQVKIDCSLFIGYALVPYDKEATFSIILDKRVPEADLSVTLKDGPDSHIPYSSVDIRDDWDARAHLMVKPPDGIWAPTGHRVDWGYGAKAHNLRYAPDGAGVDDWVENRKQAYPPAEKTDHSFPTWEDNSIHHKEWVFAGIRRLP